MLGQEGPVEKMPKGTEPGDRAGPRARRGCGEAGGEEVVARVTMIE